jgi:hypothetical protein
MVAAKVGEQVAKKVEDRLWQWAKVLGLAMTIFLAGLGFFGFTSYQEARSRINGASQAAIGTLNTVAKQTEQAVVQTGAETTSQMQQQAELARTQVASVVSGTKASKGELERVTHDLNVEKARIEELRKIRDQHPDTPIGNITGSLFSLTQGQGLNGNKPLDSWMASTSTAYTGVTPPYKEGATGPGVTEIQTRLVELGCYQGLASGTFDSDTTKAVTAFASANPPGPSDSSFLAFSPEMPSPLLIESAPGTVDYPLWGRLFSTTAKRCQ